MWDVDSASDLLRIAERACAQLAASETLAAAAGIAATSVAQLCEAERCLIVHQTDDLITMLASTAPPEAPGLLEVEVTAALASLRTGDPRHVEQTVSDGAVASTTETVTTLALPLRRGGEVAAVAVCSWPVPRGVVGDDALRACGAVCAAAALALDRHALGERLAAHDETDPLTGARTRRGLESLLGGLSERGEPHALILVDLDGAGAPAGERFLVALAALLGRECRAGDVLARRADAEFALVLPGATIEAGTAVARRVVSAVSDWGHEDGLTASAGVAAAVGEEDPDVLALATAALAEARRNGDGGVWVA
jgi:diguanylate cyclase (GGDEF)-like protein